jgi:hypothetical protein
MGSFDDLIPANKSEKKGGKSFDDLIPPDKYAPPKMVPADTFLGIQLYKPDYGGRSGLDNLGIDARSLARGATAGLYMPAKAGLTAALGSGDYQSNLERERAQAAADRQAGGGGAELAGALLGAGKLSAVANSARLSAGAGITSVAPRLVSKLPGGVLGTAGKVGAIGAEGAAYGAANAYSEGTDIGKGAAMGAGGALLGTAAGAGLSKVATPIVSRLSGKEQQAVRNLERQGVKLSAGQRTGSERLKIYETEAAPSMKNNVFDEQVDQLTTAATRKAGPNPASSIDEDWMYQQDAYFKRGYDAVRASSGMTVDRQLRSELGAITRQYKNTQLPSTERRIISSLASEIAGKRRISGEQYITYLKHLKKQAGLYRKNQSFAADALNNMVEAIEATADRQMPAALVNQKRQLDRQFAAYKNLTRAGATGEKKLAAEGRISPADLQRVVRGALGPEAYSRGRGPLTRLSKDANMVMGVPGNTQSAARMDANAALRLLGATGLGTGAYVLSDNAGAPGAFSVPGSVLTGAVAAMAAKPLLNRALMSKGGQAYLGNQLMPNRLTPGSATAALAGTRAMTTQTNNNQLTPEQRMLLGGN